MRGTFTPMEGPDDVLALMDSGAEGVVELKLVDETVQVDGSFALLRTGNVRFSVKRASTTIAGAITSGEGVLQTFEGTGSVWVAPTQPLYQSMRSASPSAGAAAIAAALS